MGCASKYRKEMKLKLSCVLSQIFVQFVFRRTNLDIPYVRLMSLHILGPLQFQLQKFDCIILAFVELAPSGGRTFPIAGQVRPP